MSISVRQITKSYGKQKALDQVSFEIKTGEVVGLLGPNGAGKSTMMKILTCFIPPNSGNASVCEFDVQERSLDVRKMVGYLPEHNPLYTDMYVREYLSFIAGVYKIPNKGPRVDEMIEVTGISAEQKKKIGALSKGYRQRVGLAQAMIHDPSVLILDEPTSGLDPNQLMEIRNLIKMIGREKTVMLSTHIMQEVEAVCDRAIIIDKGRIVADNKTTELTTLLAKRSIVVAEFDKEVKRSELQLVKGVVRLNQLKGNSWEIESDADEDIRPEIFNFAVENGLTVLSLQKKEQASLQEVFEHLTKNKAAG
jgi:ABC-2 type transport system ATP-binding protein